MKTFISILLILVTNNSWATCSTLDKQIKVYVPCHDYEGQLTTQKVFTYEDPNELVTKYNLTIADFDQAFFKNQLEKSVDKKISHLLLIPKDQFYFVIIDTANNKIIIGSKIITTTNGIYHLLLLFLVGSVIVNGSLILKNFQAKDNRGALDINLSASEIKKIWLTSPTTLGIFAGILTGFWTNEIWGLLIGVSVGIFSSLFGYRLINKPTDGQSALKAIVCGGLVPGIMGYFSGAIISESGLLSIPFLELMLIWLVVILIDLASSKFTLENENGF